MESHPNSDSESDPDLEATPQQPGQDKNVTAAALPHQVHGPTRQCLAASEPCHAMPIGLRDQRRHAAQDLAMDVDQDLHGLDVLAAAAQMPRREPFPLRVSSVRDDSNAR